MHISRAHFVNGITLYRLAAAPFLIFLLIKGELDIFKWMLAFSFFTDAIDGTLARKLNVASVFGARIDSIADDLTVLAGILGMVLYKQELLRSEIILLLIIVMLFIIQTVSALVRYGKFTSFHTYLAKFAAILQGTFLILLFFLPHPILFLFYAAVFVTALQLIEEIILIILLSEWRANVKGLVWVLRKER